MEAFVALSLGLQTMVSDPLIILLIFIGVFVGIVFGAIPGLTGSLGVTLLLPFTYTMNAQEGLSILISVYVGSISGGLIAAILLNIPGTPSSVVTCFDGAPMAKKGRPGDALVLGTFSSLVGGMVSAVVLVFISPVLAKIALMMGPWEYFALGMMGLCVVVSLATDDIIKGLMTATIGVLLSMVGIDPVSSVQRFTFDLWQLGAGLNMLATLMGLFAIAEILTQLNKIKDKTTILKIEKFPILPKKSDLQGNGKVFALSSVIGTVIGIMPGIGQTTAALISYSQAKQISKNPEKFGTGCPEGIIAAEASNNAVCGGALVPMLTMGIPGDLITAILLGGLIMHGLQPGPALFQQNQDVIGTIFIAFIAANILMYIMQMGLMRVFINMLKVPPQYLYPLILLMCCVGTLTVNNRIFDLGVLFAIGIVGYILVSCGFSLTPAVLGYVLGPIIEVNFRIAIVSFQGNLASILTRPASIVFLLVGILLLALAVGRISRKQRAAKALL